MDMQTLERGPTVKSTYSLRTRQIQGAPRLDDAPSLHINTQDAVKIFEESSSTAAKKLVRYRTVHKRTETPEQKARRLLKYKERQEEKRAQWAMETPEQTAERKLKINELSKKYRRLRRDREPEKCAEQNKRNYQKRKQKFEIETPEQTAERLLKIRKNRKKFEAKEKLKKAANFKIRALTKPSEGLTPEQIKERRLKCRLSYKKKMSMETPEQKAERILKKAEHRKLLQMQLDSETPEQKEERRQKNRARYMKRIAMETPEQKTERILRTREYYRRLRKTETPEQREKRLAKYKDKRMLQIMERDALTANADEVPTVRFENIDDEFDETCTWSSFGTSEGFYSQASKDGICSQITTTTEDNSILQDGTDALDEVESKPISNFKLDSEIQSASCAKTNEYLDKKRQIEEKILEEKQKRQLKNKKHRDKLRAKWAMETPEQTAERKLKAKEALKIANLLRLAKETPEQAAKRKAAARERSQKKRTMETPEQKAKRNLESNEYKKHFYMQRKTETPEQAAERLRIKKERANKIRKLKLARESPERMARIIMGEDKDAFESKVKLESIDEDLDESCTWSSLGGSEITSIDGSCSRTAIMAEECSMMEVNDIDSTTKREENISDIKISGDLIDPGFVQDVIVKEEIEL